MLKYGLYSVLNVQTLAADGKLHTTKLFVRCRKTEKDCKSLSSLRVLRTKRGITPTKWSGPSLIPLPKHRIPTHPSTILTNDFLIPHQLRLPNAAQLIGIRPSILKSFIDKKLKVKMALARKLQKAFHIDAHTWLNLQYAYDLWKRNQCNKEIIFPTDGAR